MVGGKVVDHVDFYALKNVEFKVREAGRQRVLREKRKNVHAFCVGEYFVSGKFDTHSTSEVTYNPYTMSTFQFAETGVPIYTANHIILIGGKIYVID